MATAANNTFFLDNRHIVHAPTFRTERQFDAAVGRAFMDDLAVEPTEVAGRYRVTNGRSGATYWTSRTACSCIAGERGIACKHVARVILALDVFGEMASPAAKAS